jgi:hypothetical protein
MMIIIQPLRRLSVKFTSRASISIACSALQSIRLKYFLSHCLVKPWTFPMKVARGLDNVVKRADLASGILIVFGIFFIFMLPSLEKQIKWGEKSLMVGGHESGLR